MSDTKRIIDLALRGPRGINRGAAMAIKGRLEKAAVRGQRNQAQREFLSEFLDQPRAADRGAYNHPRNGAVTNVDRKKAALDPSDLAWLDRLPKDPTKLSLKQGHASQSDRRLVQSIYGPIKALHDKAEATHDLELARRPLQKISQTARAAVAEALCNDDPNLDPEMADVLARRELDAALAVEEQKRYRAIEGAERRLQTAGGDPADGDDDYS
jgi:hypothetical protein